LSEIKIKFDEAFNEYLIMNNELIIVDEITDEKIKDYFKRLKISICFPLIGKEGLIGMVNIGDKLSEEPYTNEDLRILSPLANQASIALENAKLIQREGEMKRKLQQAEKLASLGRFAAGLVHEIKNPLVSVKAFFQLFGDKDESEEDKVELSELASQEIIRIEGLLDNLLNFAKPSSPDFSYEDLYEVLSETVQLVKPEMSARKVALIVEKDRETLPKVKLDRKQIKQVFLNLIYNSLDAMLGGGELRIKISLDSIGKRLIAEVKDNGCGIEEKDIDKLFDPFYSTKADGTGLGLAISYNIIKNHNGDIDVQSEPGFGSTFKISLPVS
jgi:signal transduction histidine kinase